MAATPLATRADVEARLRRSLTDAEAGDENRWINGILEEASLLVTSYCGRQFDAPVPDEVRVVTSRVAARGVTALPAAATPETGDIGATMGPFAFAHKLSADASSGGVYLTKADKLVLSAWRFSGQAFSVDMA